MFQFNLEIREVFQFIIEIREVFEFNLEIREVFESNLEIREVFKFLSSPRHRNTWLVSSGVSLTSWGEGASLALVGHPSSDGITIKIPYVVDVLLH